MADLAAELLERDHDLQRRLLGVIREADGYGRLVTAHGDDALYRDPESNPLFDFRTDQEHNAIPEMIAFDRGIRGYPVVNAEFGYERGVEKFSTWRVEQNWEEVLRRAYMIYLAGGYGVYYYHNTAWDVVKPDPEPPGMRRFQVLKETLSALPYWRMEPAHHLAVGGPCLALAGVAYACYVEQNLTINLLGLKEPEKARAEWVNTWTGERVKARAARAVLRMKKPESFADAPALLVVVGSHEDF